MPHENARRIYRRLFIFGLLSVCLVAFSYSDYTERALAAPCQEECDAMQAVCFETCREECTEADGVCNSCIVACHHDWQDCSRVSVFCGDGPYYNGRCSVEFGTHCEDGGCFNTHSGYYEICEEIGGPCVACPGGEYCPGAGGLPPC